MGPDGASCELPLGRCPPRKTPVSRRGGGAARSAMTGEHFRAACWKASSPACHGHDLAQRENFRARRWLRLQAFVAGIRPGRCGPGCSGGEAALSGNGPDSPAVHSETARPALGQFPGGVATLFWELLRRIRRTCHGRQPTLTTAEGKLAWGPRRQGAAAREPAEPGIRPSQTGSRVYARVPGLACVVDDSFARLHPARGYHQGGAC